MRLELDPTSFLARYWQREALFLPAGMGDFEPPADADELAGLALEGGVDARIIRGADRDWSLQSAPLELEDLQRDGAWTLLVQAVDHYWDEAAALLDALPFLPRWRLADVMMSYATDRGSAGPHYDQYDVFIIQGEGERRWQLGQRCDEQSPLLPAPGLRLLADFEPRAEYRMRQGDVLYIPPGIAHWGISEGESTSFSIGLRAPRMADLLARWTDTRLETLGEGSLFRDAGRGPARREGEFTGEDLELAREQLRALLDDADPRWFGEVITQPAGNADSDGEAADLPPVGPMTLWPLPGNPIAWFDEGERLLLCAAGDSCHVPASLEGPLRQLGSGAALTLPPGEPDPALRQMLQWLLERATLIAHDD